MATASQAGRFFLYLLGVLLFFETCSRLVLIPDRLFDRIAGDDASSFRLAWIRRGHEPGLAYAFDVYHPVRGWALSPNLRDVAVFSDRTLNSNSKGQRGREEHEYEKKGGRPRILVYGDSFTFGEEVSDSETYPAVLSRLMPGAEVINCGVHGYGHDQMLLYLEEDGVFFHPDVVILGFVAADMERNLLSFRDFAKPRFVLGKEGLRLVGTPVPTPDEVLRTEAYRSKFADLLQILAGRSAAWSGARAGDMQRLTAALLDAFRSRAAAAGARVILAYLPVFYEVGGQASPTEGESFFSGYCAERRAECLDLRPAFLARVAAGDRFKSSGHWNRREHEYAAELLRAALSERHAAE